MEMKALFLFVMLVGVIRCGLDLHISSPSAEQFESTVVIRDGLTLEQFQSKIYENQMICTNGLLKLVQFNASKNQPEIIQFEYFGIDILTKQQIRIERQPNLFPFPQVLSVQANKFTISSGCSLEQSQVTNDNYFNQIKITLDKNPLLLPQAQFSFLINCDHYNRHKKFQLGYLIIGFINAAITIGVALHSRIWSIKFNQKPLRIELTWKKFLLIMIVLLAMGATFYLVAKTEFKLANQIIKYIGLIVALVFTFICFNQILYLFRPFKKIIVRNHCYNLRLCEIASILGALILFVISLFVQNWLLYTFLAGCICVGSIKMLYFSSMKQAFYSLAISVCTITLIAIILHYALPRSYNDYASQLSSPLFIQVPDLVNNLFKKCSWLPVVDIIVPGVLLSFLRTYDQNFSTGWGGVYTITGNLSFLIATTLWIGVQALYPFSVPFSLVTYSVLLLSICVVAFKRNQLKTLWFGYFLQQREISSGLLKQDQTKKQFRQHIDEQTMNAIRIRDSISSKGDDEQVRQMINDRLDQPFNPKVVQSAFMTKRQTREINKNDNKSDLRSSNKKSNPFASSLR